MRTRHRVVPRAPARVAETQPARKYQRGIRAALVAAAVMALGALATSHAHASRLLVSSALNNSLLRYDGQTAAFTDLFAPPASGGLNYPEGIAFGADGNLYVRSSGSILKFNGTTGVSMGTFATSNGQDPSSYAFQVRLDGGSFVATPATGGIDGPTGLVFGPDGNLYVSSYGSILRYSGQNGVPIGTFASGGGLVNATGLTFGPDGNLYVSSYPGNSVLKYNGITGAFLGAFVTANSGGLDRPIGLAFGPDNNLYVCSYNSNSVLRYNGTTGAFMGVFTSGGGLNGPTGLSFGPDGNLYVASYGSSSVPRFNGTTGAFTDYFVPSGANGLSGPFSVCFYVEAPSSLTATAMSTSQINLSWANVSPDASGVEIDRRTGSGSYTVVAVVSPNTTSYNDNSLAQNTSYTYRVRAVNSTLASGFTGEATAITPSAVPLSPTNLTANVYGNQVNLSWVDHSNNETAYEIYRKTGSGSYALAGVLPANSTSFFDPSAAVSTTYTYRVRAANDFFASGYTNELTITTGNQSPVTAPTGLTATATGALVNLSWADKSTNETAFEIYRKPAGGSYTLAGVAGANATSYADMSAAVNTTYTYRVRAANDLFASGYTNEVTVTTGSVGAVAAPTNLTANVYGNQVNLSWVDHSNNETAYEIYRKTGSGSYALAGVLPANSTTFFDPSAAVSTTYTYRVRAANDLFASGYTNELTITTGADSPVAAPDGLSAIAVSQTQVNLSWVDHSNNETAYEIYRKTGSGSYALVGVLGPNSTGFADTSASASTSYTYRVRAANNSFASAYTNEATVTTSSPALAAGK